MSDISGSSTDATIGALRRYLAIANKRGLHARASAKFVQTVERYEADVTVSRAGESVNGLSIMGLMMLAAAFAPPKPWASVRMSSCGSRSKASAIAPSCWRWR